MEEEVSFPARKGDHSLAGTLTMPKEGGPFPAVILISGSGPQNDHEAFLDHRPFLVLSDLYCPVLALFGEKDLQVAPAQNVEPVRKALAHNKTATINTLPDLNHLFQTVETGASSEYATTEETISPVALNLMSEWIL